MNIRAGGHAALIVAAGLWISVSGPFLTSAATAQTAAEQPAAVGSATGVQAEPTAQPTRQKARKSASKSRKADRQAKAKKSAEQETAKADDAKSDKKPEQDNAMPQHVANANAQWPSDPAAANTYNMSAQAGNVLSQMDAQPAPHDATAGDTQVVSSDQLNDLDRAAEEQPPLTLAKATIDAPAAPAPAATTVENNTPWEQTSVIGKVFIALGGLLTVASAARMFIA